MKQIKNEHGVILRDLDMIIGRWKGYFDKLLNEENPRHRLRDGGSGGQLTPQFGQIHDIYSGKRQHNCLTNCVTPNGTSIHLPEIHFGWGSKGDVHRVLVYDHQK